MEQFQVKINTMEKNAIQTVDVTRWWKGYLDSKDDLGEELTFDQRRK